MRSFALRLLQNRYFTTTLLFFGLLLATCRFFLTPALRSFALQNLFSEKRLARTAFLFNAQCGLLFLNAAHLLLCLTTLRFRTLLLGFHALALLFLGESFTVNKFIGTLLLSGGIYFISK